tara:strand:- start:477 stop:1208 length:732 start_codon:yes stop_codon:yes gene_type:complete
MVDNRCPRCNDYDEVVEELKKEKDSRERGAKDELRKCEEKNKTRDKNIKGLEKKIITMTIAAVVGGTIVGKDVLDKIAEYIQSFNSIKDAATKLTTSVDNDSNKEVVKKDVEQEETEYTRTLTFAPRKFSTGEWPSLMSTADIQAYQSRTRVDYGLSLTSMLVDDSFTEIPTLMDIIIEDVIENVRVEDFDTYDTISDIVAIPPITVSGVEMMTMLPATAVPESNAWILFAGIPMICRARRRR